MFYLEVSKSKVADLSESIDLEAVQMIKKNSVDCGLGVDSKDTNDRLVVE